jgi:hypothetical protein
MRQVFSGAVLVWLFGCTGKGTDVGPSLPRLPGASTKFSVLDDAGRGVAGATVQVGSSSLRAVSGRNGRGDLLADPRGRQVLRVSGAAAAAVDGDALGTLAVATTASGSDLPGPWFLPDLSGSDGAPLPVGTQVAVRDVHESVAQAAHLRIAAGSSLGLPTPEATVTVRLGTLAPEHLPGELPTAPGQALLWSRGVFVDPPALTCAPAAALDLVDDLHLGGNPASLYHLDPDSGEWQQVGSGLVAAAGRLQAPSSVARGGLYAFAVAVPAGSVRGRVIDTATPPNGQPGQWVRVDGATAITDALGGFLCVGVPAQYGDGAARTAAIEVHAAGDWLPARATATVAMAGVGEVTAADVLLDTRPAGNVRVQLVRRGLAEPDRRVALSSVFDGVVRVGFADGAGQATLEDVPAQWFGHQEGFPLDRERTFYSQNTSYLPPARRWLATARFFDDRQWWSGSRSTRVVLTDALGGGPIQDAAVVRGRNATRGYVGKSTQGGSVFTGRDMGGRITGVARIQRAGETFVHAVSVEAPSAVTMQLPLQQPRRPELGQFERHGVLEGRLLGADPSREHRLRATRRLDLQEWWDDVASGQPLPARLPIDVDPATTHDAFRCGVANGLGHVVAVETTTAAGVATLRKLGLLLGLQGQEGAVQSLDLTLGHAADTVFPVGTGLVGLDAALAVADLRLDLALRRPTGLGVDVARGLGGNHRAIGSDLELDLPALSGPLAGHRWLALLQGSATVGATTRRQGSLLQLGGGAVQQPFLPVPEITAPDPGAVVDVDGFRVDFTLPAEALYGVVELRSQSAGELLLWQAYVPPDATSFEFVKLPSKASTPLLAGKSYTLTVTAYRARSGPMVGVEKPYRRLTGYLQSIGEIERGVDAFAAVSMPLSTP